MTIITNFMIYFIFQVFIFKIFFKNVTDLHLIPAALLLITSFFFRIKYFHCVLCKEFTKLLHTIFTFYTPKWRYCRHWKTWWMEYVLLLLLQMNFQDYCYIHQFFVYVIHHKTVSIVSKYDLARRTVSVGQFWTCMK